MEKISKKLRDVKLQQDGSQQQQQAGAGMGSSSSSDGDMPVLSKTAKVC
jgi:hypothetical protein